MTVQTTPGAGPVPRLRLGVIGGVGPLATADFYLALVAAHQRATGGSYPDVVIHSLALPADLERAFISGRAGPREHERIDELLGDALDVFERGGAAHVALPCNTLHARLPRLLRGRSLEWIDMIAAVRRRVAERGHRRVLLLGTSSTVRSGLYRGEQDGIRFVPPAADVQPVVEELVLDCLRGDLSDFPASRLRALTASAGQVDAVVLACTDLHLLRGREDLDLPVVDSLSCLADACLESLVTGALDASHREVLTGAAR